MDYRLNRCPICGSSEIEKIDEEIDNNDVFYVYHCLACEETVRAIKKIEKPLDLAKKESKSSLNDGSRGYTAEEIFRNHIDGIVELHTIKGNKGFTGTGFYIDEHHIVTNRHVVYDKNNNVARSVSFTFYKDDTHHFVKVLGYSEKVDLAVLETDIVGKPLTLAKEEPQIGQDCFVIGNANGEGLSMVQGIVSDISREVDKRQEDFLLTTTLSIGGDSGGPIINRQGEVISMLTMVGVDAVMMNYSVKACDIRKYAAKIINKED